MTIAVTVPDEVFDGAERLASRNQKSLDQIYSEALQEYVARHSPDEITRAMNRVCDQLGGDRSDPFVSAAATRTLEASEW